MHTRLARALELADWNDALQVHGFLTQGFVKTSANNFFGDSEDGSFDFTELGVNASYRLNPRLMASAQLLSRKAGLMYDGSPDVDYAQIDYMPYARNENRFGVILGRFKNPYGLYNETRDVAATRPSIFVPQVIYWDRVRNLVLSNDGGLLYGNLHRGLHDLSLRLYAGKSPIDENVEKTYLPPNAHPNLRQQGLTKGGQLLYEWDGGVFRLALSGVFLKLDGETHPAPGVDLSGDLDLKVYVGSLQYNRGPWSLTMEYLNEPIDFHNFGPMDAGDTTVDGYYLQSQYRLSADWEWLVRYEEAHFDKDDRSGTDTAARIPGTFPYNHYVRMWTLGMLWEPTEKLLLRAELSRADGTIFLSNLENPDPRQTQRFWNMFALLVSYSF